MGLQLKYVESSSKYRVYTLFYLGTKLCDCVQDKNCAEFVEGIYDLSLEPNELFGRRMFVFDINEDKILLQYINRLIPISNNIAFGLYTPEKGLYRSKLIFEEVLITLKLIYKDKGSLTLEIINTNI